LNVKCGSEKWVKLKTNKSLFKLNFWRF